MNAIIRMTQWTCAQVVSHKATGLIGASLLMAGAAVADPVPVTSILTTPGFTSGLVESNGQALAYIQMDGEFYAPVGARCTTTGVDDVAYAVNEPNPLTGTNALSGLKFTQSVVNMGAGGRISIWG